MLERDRGKEAKKRDIGDMDLEGIKNSSKAKGDSYVPQEELIMLREYILKAWASNQLGISLESHKETKQKIEEPFQEDGQEIKQTKICKRSKEFGRFKIVPYN